MNLQLCRSTNMCIIPTSNVLPDEVSVLGPYYFTLNAGESARQPMLMLTSHLLSDIVDFRNEFLCLVALWTVVTEGPVTPLMRDQLLYFATPNKAI